MPDQENPQEQIPTIRTGDNAVFSVNQRGGITTGSFHQYGQQPRTISDEAAEAMVKRLAAYPGTAIDVTPLAGVADGVRLSERLRAIFTRAGWQVSWAGSLNVAGLEFPPGILINDQAAGDKSPYDVLIVCLRECEMKVERGGIPSSAAAARLIVSHQE